MNYEQALHIVSALTEGVDPISGEVVSAESSLNSPPVLRALYKARESLQVAMEAEQRKSRLPENAGKPWSEEEDRRLVEGFESSLSVAELATEFKRTRSAISARLEKLGKLPGTSPLAG